MWGKNLLLYLRPGYVERQRWILEDGGKSKLERMTDNTKYHQQWKSILSKTQGKVGLGDERENNLSKTATKVGKSRVERRKFKQVGRRWSPSFEKVRGKDSCWEWDVDMGWIRVLKVRLIFKNLCACWHFISWWSASEMLTQLICQSQNFHLIAIGCIFNAIKMKSYFAFLLACMFIKSNRP